MPIPSPALLASLAASTLLLTAVPAVLRTQGAPAASLARQQARTAFDRLQRLEGEWQGKIGRDSSRPAFASFLLTAKGTALIERIIIDDPVEMVSVYYLERSGLTMMHYCAAGNQPRMVLAARSPPSALGFRFAGGANLDPVRDLHMHGKEVVIVDPDHIQMIWHTFAKGRAVSIDTMFLSRSAGKPGR